MTRHPRRLQIALVTVAALGAVTLTPVVSHADTSSTVTVVGTSDVFDSDLVQQVIKPDFEKAYPQYTLNYVSLGTGAAIAYAEAGTASALLVHAASLENQFVAPGGSQVSYSYDQYGDAIFYGDYVLLGPASDPAGVLSGGQPSHDIVSAFEKIAAAGEAGTANFVSRGGTPGTTVQEHAIWADTTGVTTCPVTTANGGGAVPDQNGGACTTLAAPSWYHTTGLTQGPNVVAADNGANCNFPSNNGDCYVLTDRGTFQYLESEGALKDLHVVVNDDGGTSDQQDLLINSFHAYAINPAAFTSSNVQLNLPGAQAFLSWLTSPAGQADVNAYDPGDTGNPPFKADAAPALTASLSASSVASGKALTVSGTLTNKVPGTPALAGVAMTLSAKAAGAATAKTVATTNTSASGAYSFSVKPTTTATYTVSSAKIAQVENASLSPVFGDLLQATSTSAGTAAVVATAVVKTVTASKKGAVTVTGTLSPAVVGSGATLKVYAARGGKSFGLKATETLRAGATTFTGHLTLATGVTWKVRVVYAHPGVIVAGTSAAKSVHVP